MSSLSISLHKVAESLKGKTLLFVALDIEITFIEEIPVSTWMRLKELGLKSAVVVLRESSLNSRWCSKLKTLGVIDQYNVDGLVNGRGEVGHAETDAEAIVTWLETKHIKIHALASQDDYGQLVSSYIGRRLGIRSNSCESIKTAFLKDATQKAVLQDPRSSKHGVPSYVVKTEKQLIAATNKLQFPMVLKPVSGCSSDGCRLVNDLDECRDFFNVLTGEDNGNAFRSVLVMEYIEGPKFCVDVIIYNGTLIGGATCQRGPVVLPYFWPTTKTFPGDVSEEKHDELVAAAFKCCKAVGLSHGVYNVDLILDKARVPKMIEINPRPAGDNLCEMYTEVYRTDVLLLNYLLCCGVELSIEDLTMKPQIHAAAYCVYLQMDKERIQRAIGSIISMAKNYGVTLFNSTKKTAVEILQEDFDTTRPILTMMATDEISREEAIKSLARFLVDTTYFSSMGEALSIFQK